MIFEESDTITFARPHRWPPRTPGKHRHKVNLRPVLVALGVILLVATGVMINTDLHIF